MSERISNLKSLINYSHNENQEGGDLEQIEPFVASRPLMEFPTQPPNPPSLPLQTDDWRLGYLSQNVSPFLGQSGLTVEVPREELGFFKLILNDTIVQYMVDEMNSHATRVYNEEQLKTFIKITPAELNNYLCLMLYMGICKLPTYDLYWQKSLNPFYSELPGGLMNYKRYIVVKKHFQVFDIKSEDTDMRLSKLDELINQFNTIFSTVYQPGREIVLDENLCSWYGLGGTKLFIPPDTSNYNKNLYALCEGKSGYACNLMMHNSKTSEKNAELALQLTRNYHNKNHRLYMDNFFTCTPVFNELRKVGIYCCGTYRETSSGPKGFRIGIKKIKNSKAYMRNNGEINRLELGDSLASAVFTNIHPENEVLATDNGTVVNPGIFKDVRQCHILQDFNIHTSEVGFMDQMTKYYEADKKSKSWSSKLGVHVLNIAFYNSYCLYKKYTLKPKPKPYLQYLIDLIHSLRAEGLQAAHDLTLQTGVDADASSSDDDNSGPLQPRNPKTPRRYIRNEREVGFRITHFPVLLAKRTRCAYCTSKKRRRVIQSKCKKCDVPLCHIGCFEKWHND